jgi:hypothetical protein
MSVLRITPQGVENVGDRLAPIIESLRRRHSHLSSIPVATLLALLDDFSGRLLRDERTRSLDGVMFLAAWLRQSNLQKLLELNINGKPGYLDGFLPVENNLLAAKPQGLVAMWMAGNVSTLPMFSLAPGLLAKNVCLVKLAAADPVGMDRLLAVLSDSGADGLRGGDLLEDMAIVWFDYRQQSLNEEMSLAADARVVWGGHDAVRAITALPRQEHCNDIIFGPKYSIGVIDAKRIAAGGQGLEDAVAAFVRDVAIFDQRACSAPQTIFVERNNSCSLRDIGRTFARHLDRLPAKPSLDSYTTMRIASVRAEWAMDESRDVIASAGGANWTVCMDGEVSLKEAVQSRTIFLTEVPSWREIIPLLSPKVQTAGIAFADRQDAIAFAEAATAAGVVRCVRPGLMNNYESPWDGKLLLNQLVRWVILKP